MFDAMFELHREVLACPRTKQPLALVSRTEVEALGFRPAERVGAPGKAPVRCPMTEQMLVTGDRQAAFPIIDGMPILLWPEVFTTRDERVDLSDRIYVEAYYEMSFYNTRADAAVDAFNEASPAKSGPRIVWDEHELREHWVDSLHETKAMEDTVDYLAPLRGSDFVQLGGDGRFAIKALRAGARRAILITPMISEARQALATARLEGLEDELLCVIAIGEEAPLQDATVDKVFSPGSMHHMRLDVALPQIKAALRKGGRFAAFDPWRAPLYGVGSAVFGKRSTGLFKRSGGPMCTPLTEESIDPLKAVFPNNLRRHHGPLLRYPLCACEKFGIKLNKPMMQKIAQIDDRLGEMLHLDQNTWGSSIMFGGEA